MSRSTVPEDIRWVSGVNKWRDKFQVQWRDRTNNKKHSRTFKVRTAAEAFRASCAEKIEATNPGKATPGFKLSLDDFPSYEAWEAEGRSNLWWRRVFGRLVDELLRTDDLDRQETIRKTISAAASAGKGAKPFIDQAEFDARLEELEKMAEVVKARRRHGAGTRGKFEPNPEFRGERGERKGDN